MEVSADYGHSIQELLKGHIQGDILKHSLL
jgi:hypothetical protein